MTNIHNDKILILDFGAQYTQLIARRIREFGVYCEIWAWDHDPAEIAAFGAKGIILSGGPETTTLPGAPAAPQEVFDSGLPLLGICYGHQLLAHALGGEVGFNPAGRESGTIALQLRAEAADDPLFAGLPATLPAHATHLQTVLTPPPGATVLAASARDNCQAFRVGPQAWGVQFHPEFATHHMRGYLRERAQCIARHGGDARQLVRQVHAAPQARHLLRRFIRQTRLAA